MAVVPISSGTEKYGVLDVRAVDRVFPQHTLEMLRLFGTQLGLCHTLALRLSDLNRARREQAEVYRDFRHEIRTPSTLAHGKARELVRQLSSGRLAKTEVMTLRSQCRRVEHVAQNIRLYVSLTAGEPVIPQLSKATAREMGLRLAELGEDYQFLADERQQLEIQLDRRALGLLDVITVMLDWNHLEEMVGNLLDNAVKYSFPQSAIVISVGATERGWFYISVKSESQPIRPEDHARLVEKGFRGRLAKRAASGSGIGLWIVDRLMRAHGGELEVPLTDPNGANDFRLSFPARRA